MLGIEEQHQKNFLLPSAKQQLQIVAHRARRVERIAMLHFLLQRASRHFQHGLQLRIFRRPHAMHFTKTCFAGSKHFREIAKAGEQFACQIHRTFAGNAGAQENRQQFGIG